MNLVWKHLAKDLRDRIDPVNTLDLEFEALFRVAQHTEHGEVQLVPT